MKKSFNRVLSLLLTLLMLVSMVPAFALTSTAAGTLTVTDGNIGLSWTDASITSGSANWTASGTTVTGTATGYNGGFFGAVQYSVFTELTITNNHNDDRTLSFDWSLTGDGSVSGIITENSGSYFETLAAGASVKIKLTSPSGKKTNTLTISGLALLSSGNVTSTFLAPENGSYTVDGATIKTQTQLAKAATESYALVATPATDYMFFGWWSEVSKSYVSYEATATLKFSTDPQIKPVFLHNTTALFGVGTKNFADLTEACNFANSSASTTKTVVLLNNGTVSGTHTIPAGVTLLVPYNSDNTMYGAEASCTSYSNIFSDNGNIAWVQPTAYRTLTLAVDTQITVNGAIELAGQHAASIGSRAYCGAPTGPLGWMQMASGSNITLNSGSNLYAWGYIQGSGTITAKSGAKVYENFQFTDFRGGENTGALVNEGLVFPINQYYVQNIEVATTYEYGAEEYVATSIFMSRVNWPATVKFMGDGGMFIPASGSTITKDYIENRDRMQIDVNGNGTLNPISLSLAGTKINSATFVLPMTNNIVINIHSGTTTVNQSVSLLPGVEMTIDSEAVLVIAEGSGGINDYTTESYGLIVYDYDEWTYGIDLSTGSTVTGKYAFSNLRLRPLPYAPGRTYNRTEAKDLADAKLDVNGKIVCNGYIYTTLGGGNIMSSEKTGIILLNNGAGKDMMDFQANDGTALVIPMNSAQLRNGDGSYESTYIYSYDDNGQLVVDYQAPANTTYNYCATHDKWYTGECDECAATPATVEITWVVDSVSGTQEVDYNTVPVYNNGTDPTKAADGCTTYTFAGWSTTANGTVLDSLPAATGDATYYAIFTKATSHSYTVEVEGTRVPATCMATGSVTMQCANCTATQVKTLDKDSDNHTGNNTTGVNAKDATCTEDGYTGDTVCECGVTVAYGTVIEAKKHDYNAYGKCNNSESCPILSGWNEIDEDWYYFYGDGNRAEGVTRVPYPTVEINDVTYAPNDEDKEYTDFIDADEAWFIFDDDGKFRSDLNGMDTYLGATRWVDNGMIAWHPGVVEVDGSYYYFIGDETNGGNIMDTGDVYVSRNTTDRDVTIGGVYTFDTDGKLCEYDGVTEMADGTLRYYDDARLMLGAGLVEVQVDGEVKYIYVRSNGQLVVNNERYTVSKTNGLPIAEGAYKFDENGYMVLKTGIYAEDGGLYYYENGYRTYKGLILYDDGDVYNKEWIYVRSNGQLATGTYWITAVNDTEFEQGYYEFNENGIMQERKDGIIAENGSLYYYVDGSKAYNAGVIEIGGDYYYVRSNGEVVNNRSYWITNVGDSGVVAKQYTFNETGVMQNPEFTKDLKNGIIDGYYYVDGNIAYGAGLMKLTDENGDEYYIYVRSNGQLATGTYWTTNHNGVLLEGSYDFGTDGKYYAE